MKAYIDTSLLAAYYCPEAGSAAAEKALQAAEPAISWLGEVELASAIGRKVREGNLSRAAAARIADLFNHHVGEGYFQVLGLGSSHFRMARENLARFDSPLRSLDALHLAVAEAAGLPLLTFDEKMHAAAKRRGISSMLIRDAKR